MEQLLQDMGTEFQLLFFAFIIAVVFFVIWLAMRKSKLWYWKVNEQTAALVAQTDTLTNIDKQLKIIGESLSERVCQGKPVIQTGVLKEDCQSTMANMESDLLTICEEQGAGEIRTRNKFLSLYQGQSKSGHVYTAEQIEAQIRE